MATLLTAGNSDGSRRCDAKCHDATEPECDCVCGGRYHGQGSAAARDLLEQDVLDGRYGAEVADAAAAQLAPEALQGRLF